MSNKPLLNVTPGLIITLWRIVFITQNRRTSNISKNDIFRILNDSGFFGGTIPIDTSIQLGLFIELFYIKNNNLYLTSKSINSILPLCQSINPNIKVIRKIIFLILSKFTLPWVIFFTEDINIFKTSIPENWIENLNNADLLDLSNNDVMVWWKKLLNEYQTHYNTDKSDTGEVGELLTLNFEKARLEKDGISNTDYWIRWVSKFSDSIGYDITSLRGSLLQSLYKKEDSINIEVKCSEKKDVNNFVFFVTRNEWETMIYNPISYYFYCWTGINVNNKNAENGPYIFSAKQILDKFPADISIISMWTECRFTINLNTISINTTYFN